LPMSQNTATWAYNRPRVALETTLLLHGVPPDQALPMYDDLAAIVTAAGAQPRAMAVLDGRPVSDLSRCQLQAMLAGPSASKINTSSMGVVADAWWRGQGPSRGHGATTVSTTMEMAAMAGIRVFATGGLGGVHKGYGTHWDVSADLYAFTRFPVAVVTSGCKSILDVQATREMLETLGVPVIGYRTDRFPAFYTRDGGCGVDARFDDAATLAAFVRHEMARTCRGVVIANPIPEADEIDPVKFAGWLAQAEAEAAAKGATGRAVTPAVLGALHRLSGGATLKANIALVRHNVAVAAEVAVAMGEP
jgi:pseudouridine-5'-phosphate glycosidase